MKVLRWFSLALGLAALGFTGYYVYATIDIPWSWQHIWILISYWPRGIIFFAGHPQFLLQLSPLAYGRLVTHVGAVILSVVSANSLNRSRLDWGVWGFLFPYLAPTILVFLKKRSVRGKSAIGRFVGALASGGSSTSKTCGACGKPVSLTARAGQRCPHCGAYWGGERTIRR